MTKLNKKKDSDTKAMGIKSTSMLTIFNIKNPPAKKKKRFIYKIVEESIFLFYFCYHYRDKNCLPLRF